jgi:hypothetical protein
VRGHVGGGEGLRHDGGGDERYVMVVWYTWATITTIDDEPSRESNHTSSKK